MTNDIHPDVTIDSFDENGRRITFRIDAGDCIDSAGRFEYSVSVKRRDGSNFEDIRRINWTRTHNTSRFYVDDSYWLGDGESLNDVIVVDSTVEAQCYATSSIPSQIVEILERVSASREKSPTFFDIDEFVLSQVHQRLRQMGARESEISWFKSVDTNIVSGFCDYSDVIRRGVQTSIRRDRLTIRNNSDQPNAEDRVLKALVRSGGSARIEEKITYKSSIGLNLSLKGFGGSGSESNEFNMTKTRTADWSKEDSIERRNKWPVNPYSFLVVDMVVSTRNDAQDFDGIFIVNGSINIDTGISKMTLPLVKVLRTQQDRMFRLKGRLFNVEISETNINIDQRPLTEEEKKFPEGLTIETQKFNGNTPIPAENRLLDRGGWVGTGKLIEGDSATLADRGGWAGSG